MASKVLICVPYHRYKRYSLNHLFDWVDEQTHDVIIKVHTGKYGEKEILKKTFNYFRQLTLDGDYTHLLIVEADTIPPTDAIDKLLNNNVDVVSGLYRYRDEEKNIVAWGEKETDKNIVEVDGTGTGCLLLSRKALKNDWTYDQIDADYPYMDKLRKNGIQPYLNKTVVCKHFIDGENCA